MPNIPNPVFNVVFGEVCLDDYYGLRSAPFTPDVIIDLGANVGAFTLFARFLFPSARIVAVEPNPSNYKILQELTGYLPDIRYLARALGIGPIWQGQITVKAPYYGTLQSYVSQGQVGFPKDGMNGAPNLPGRDGLPRYARVKRLRSASLAAIVGLYTKPEDRLLVKIDCEGGENSIFTHEPSMESLRRIDWLTMETHYYTKGTGTQYKSDRDFIEASLLSLSSTHDCDLNRETRHFQAIRKGPNG